MEEKTEEIIREFLGHSDELTEGIYSELEATMGRVPFIFPAMSEKKEVFIFNSLSDLNTARPKTLDGKTAEIATVAAAAALGADKCLGVHIVAALKEGVSRSQILDAILIGAMINKTRSLAISLKVLEKFSDGE